MLTVNAGVEGSEEGAAARLGRLATYFFRFLLKRISLGFSVNCLGTRQTVLAACLHDY